MTLRPVCIVLALAFLTACGGGGSGSAADFESSSEAVVTGATNFVDLEINEDPLKICTHITSGFELEASKEMTVFVDNATDSVEVSLVEEGSGNVLGPYAIAPNAKSKFTVDLPVGGYTFDCGFEAGIQMGPFQMR